jgi:hypothetical protein
MRPSLLGPRILVLSGAETYPLNLLAVVRAEGSVCLLACLSRPPGLCRSLRAALQCVAQGTRGVLVDPPGWLLDVPPLCGGLASTLSTRGRGTLQC